MLPQHTMRFGSTAKLLAICKLKYYRILECSRCLSAYLQASILPENESCCTVRFGSTAKVLLRCKLKYYRISECAGPMSGSH